jgi:GrpB-like predicted nucleotidyltransferase (UPF0157 family)
MARIVVVDPDPDWPKVFESLRSTLWPALADIALSIEHVGSTSVPGLAAKPVIDVDVVVPPERVAEGILRLIALGYEHLGERGVPGRDAFRRPPASPLHHLYLCPSNSPALANHLAVRDHLRSDPEAARIYGDLKRCLAIEFADDVEGYVEAKTEFLLGILRARGFGRDALEEIERINQRPKSDGQSRVC